MLVDPGIVRTLAAASTKKQKNGPPATPRRVASKGGSYGSRTRCALTHRARCCGGVERRRRAGDRAHNEAGDQSILRSDEERSDRRGQSAGREAHYGRG